MKKSIIIIIILVIALLIVLVTYLMKKPSETNVKNNTIIQKEEAVQKQQIDNKPIVEKSSDDVLSSLQTKLQIDESKTRVNMSSVTNNLITPYIAMKNEIPNNVEDIITLMSGFPKYLTEEEIELRTKVYDAYNKLPELLQFWNSLDEEYYNMTNAVLRQEEIDKIIELYEDDWNNLTSIADRLLYGENAYRDLPAARKILEYVWKTCPAEVINGDEYIKYNALQFLAQSYITAADSDYMKNIELWNIMDKEFTHDYGKEDNKYKSQYFWPGILNRAISYSMLNEYDNVDHVYERFDQAYKNYPEEDAIRNKKYIKNLETMNVIMYKYSKGKISQEELIMEAKKCAKAFDENSKEPGINAYAKQKNIINRDQALNVIKYIKEH